MSQITRCKANITIDGRYFECGLSPAYHEGPHASRFDSENGVSILTWDIGEIGETTVNMPYFAGGNIWMWLPMILEANDNL